MDIYRLIHLVIKNLLWLVFLPLLAGALMYLLTMKQSLKYSTRASVFTAITSNTSLEDLGQSRVDYFATKTAYNNLLSVISSDHVITQTSIRLLAKHLVLKKPVYNKLSEKSFTELHEIIPSEIVALVDYTSEEKTYQNLRGYLKQDKDNFLYGLLNFDHPHYSHKAISKVKTIQMGGSDIIELSYQSNDPGVAYETLKILIDIFIERYAGLKKTQTNAVVGYFETQLKKASEQLSDAEDRLLIFNKKNSIINYYEQTKHISSQQEKIEVKLQDILMEYQAASAVLVKLEDESKSRFKINLRNERILSIRKKLIKTNQELADLEIKSKDLIISSPKGDRIKREKKAFEEELRREISLLNTFENNSEGIAIETLLNEWLETVIEYESAKAKLISMELKHKEFLQLYAKYAPLGAKLKRIEREIGVKEKAYLEILHHLELAKLKQQNQEMMADMRILDEPTLSIDPEPTKRKIFVVVIVFFTFIFLLTGIVVFELLDKTIKNSLHFNQLSTLSVKGVYVLEKEYKKVKIEIVKKKGLKTVSETIINQRNILEANETIYVQFLSHYEQEGKSHIINLFKTELEKIGYNIQILNFSNQVDDFKEDNLLKDLYKKKTYRDFIQKDKNIDVVLIEVPALADNLFNTILLRTASLTYLIVDAGRTWSSADDFLLDKVKVSVITDLHGILNKMKPENMQDIIGEIPKTRSKIRRFIKHKIFKKFI